MIAGRNLAAVETADTIRKLIESGLVCLSKEAPQSFPYLYLLMLEHNDGRVEIVTRPNQKGPVVAIEGNQNLFRHIGDRLLEQELIHGYQLLKTVGHPVYEVIGEENGRASDPNGGQSA